MDTAAYSGDETDRDARIRERAYALWLEQGQPEGRDLEHWMAAEESIGGAEAPQPKDLEDTMSILGFDDENRA